MAPKLFNSTLQLFKLFNYLTTDCLISFQNLSATVKRVAEFLGKEYTAEQFDELCNHLKFDNFKKNPSVGIDNLKKLGIMEQKGEFIRKGEQVKIIHIRIPKCEN